MRSDRLPRRFESDDEDWLTDPPCLGKATVVRLHRRLGEAA
jgi:hypothetical protein